MNIQEALNILQLSQDVTHEQITNKYRKLCSKYHPDREGGSEDKMKLINVAYKTLENYAPPKPRPTQTYFQQQQYDAYQDFINQQYNRFYQNMAMNAQRYQAQMAQRAAQDYYSSNIFSNGGGWAQSSRCKKEDEIYKEMKTNVDIDKKRDKKSMKKTIEDNYIFLTIMAIILLVGLSLFFS
jgi:DnaJ-class molecular chaperone